MADSKPNTPPNNEPSPEQIKKVLIPTLAIGVVIVLVAVITSLSGGSGQAMSDGSNGTAEDPDLKEITPGVKYRDLKEGVGDPCPPGAGVKMHYKGWLVDGTEFDSGKNKDFKLTGLIQGWQEGIPGMKPGGIRKLVISPDKAYGSQSKGKIPGGSTLIFEVQLVEATAAKNFVSGPGTPMSDGSNGGTDDPGLKDIGGGLKIRDLKEGNGDPVQPGATVLANYTGWTTDGHVFDSSKKGGKPIEFSLNGVVKGWAQGIPGMKPGGIRKLVIPAALGYGDRGTGDDIPGGATLIFEVELVR